MIRLRDKLQRANKEIASVSIDDALASHRRGNVLFVDVREMLELQREGTIPGAVHASRGSLEFAIDAQSPGHNEQLRAEAEIVVFCASGMRSLLAAQTMLEMGFLKVSNLEGGFNAWRSAGGPVVATLSNGPIA